MRKATKQQRIPRSAQQPPADPKNPPEGSDWREKKTGGRLKVLRSFYARARWRVEVEVYAEGSAPLTVTTPRATLFKHYERCPAHAVATRDDQVLVTMLALVDRRVPLDVVRAWTRQQRDAAQRWAGRVHLKASDNPVRVPPEPDHVKPFAPTETALPSTTCPECSKLLLPNSPEAVLGIHKECADARSARAGDRQDNAQPMAVRWLRNSEGNYVLEAPLRPGEWLSVLGGWCDGCRQQPTMSVQRAATVKNQPHAGCPAGKGTWRLLVVVEPTVNRPGQPIPEDVQDVARSEKDCLRTALREARDAQRVLGGREFAGAIDAPAALVSAHAKVLNAVGILAGVLE